MTLILGCHHPEEVGKNPVGINAINENFLIRPF
jgi:hypothetical protein